MSNGRLGGGVMGLFQPPSVKTREVRKPERVNKKPSEQVNTGIEKGSPKKVSQEDSKGETILHAFRFPPEVSQDLKVLSLLSKKSQNKIILEGLELWKKHNRYSREDYQTLKRLL